MFLKLLWVGAGFLPFQSFFFFPVLKIFLQTFPPYSLVSFFVLWSDWIIIIKCIYITLIYLGLRYGNLEQQYSTDNALDLTSKKSKCPTINDAYWMTWSNSSKTQFYSKNFFGLMSHPYENIWHIDKAVPLPPTFTLIALITSLIPWFAIK